MPYKMSEQLIKYNRSYQRLNPVGYVIHSTGNPNDTVQGERDYFNSGDRQASVHYFVGANTIIRCIPENEVAWGCGPTGNHRYLQVEMCEGESFDEVWENTVSLVAEACVRYGWYTGPNVYSHRGISQMWHETNHVDPIEFLAKHGKTWDDLLNAIDAEMKRIKDGVGSVAEAKPDKDGYLLVRVLDSKSAEVQAQIIKMGYACKPIILP